MKPPTMDRNLTLGLLALHDQLLDRPSLEGLKALTTAYQRSENQNFILLG